MLLIEQKGSVYLRILPTEKKKKTNQKQSSKNPTAVVCMNSPTKTQRAEGCELCHLLSTEVDVLKYFILIDIFGLI